MHDTRCPSVGDRALESTPTMAPVVFSNTIVGVLCGTEVMTIHSESRVQQGDPLGRLLFTMGIHFLLLSIRANHPDVFLSAYADNCIINQAGPLSKVRAAVAEYQTTMLQAGLLLIHETLAFISQPGANYLQVS